MAITNNEEWQSYRLGEICEIKTGKKDVNAEKVDGTYPFFTCAQEVHKIDTYTFDDEAVLVAGNGFFNVKYYKGKFDAYQRTYVLHDFKPIADPQFVYHFVTSRLNEITKNNRGSTIQYIRLGDLTEQEIALPDIPEQKRLVRKIELLLSNADTSVTDIKISQRQIKRFRQSVLSAAVTGKLTEEWRENNSDKNTTDLHNKLKEKRSLAKIKTLETKQHEKDEYPFIDVLPDTWLSEKIGNISSVQGGIQKTPERSPKNNAYPYLRVANVYRGYLKLDEIVKFEITNVELEKLRLIKGDLLIVEGNGSVDQIGRCAIWNGEIKDCIHQNHIIRCRPFSEVESEYILYYLNSPVGIDTMVRISSSTSGLNTLSVNKIKDIIAPLPPIEEQQEIVRRVKSMFEIADMFDKQIELAGKRTDKLTQSILAKAFRGEL